MPGRHRPRAVALRALALLALGLTLLPACSGDDPTGPDDPNGGHVAGPDGALVAHDDLATLYAPPGAVATGTEFAIAAAGPVPDPPAGAVQVGPALEFTSSAAAFSTPVAVALEPPVDPTDDPLGVYDATTWLSRLDDAGQWRVVPGSQSIAAVGLITATVTRLGTFAIHADTTSGPADAVLARIDVETQQVAPPGGGDLAWYSSARATFTDIDGQTYYRETGGPVVLDGGDLDDNGFWYGFVRKAGVLFPAGEPVQVVVPGGREVPPLAVTADFVAHNSGFLTPSASGTEAPVDQDLIITWDDTGGDLVWLVAYGAGADGFLFLGGPTPNDGEHVVPAADLARFGPGTDVHLFLQRTRVTPITAPGFAAGSRVTATSSASVSVRLR